MNEQGMDPRMEALFREAQGREDVYRFRQVLNAVAAKVEAEEGAKDVPVVPLRGGWRIWGWLAAASVLLFFAAGLYFMRGPAPEQLAMDYARMSVPAVRGDEAVPYSGDALLDSALARILEGRPQEALTLLAAHTPADAALVCKRDWLRALATLQQGDEQQARPLIDRVIGAQCYPEAGLAKELKAAF